MGFWLTMLICDLSVPLIMIFGGLMMYRQPPKKSTVFTATAQAVQ